MASTLRQALVLLVLGAALGVAGDLLHPRSVLRHPQETLRAVELLPQILLWPAEQVREAYQAGEVLLLDVRPEEEFRARHVSGSLRGDPTATDLVDAATEAELAGRDVVVVAGAEQAELARQVAANLVLLSGAGRAVTVNGGFEALARTDLPMEGNAAEDGP